MSTTFVLTDTNSDLTSQGATHNKKALVAAEGGTSLDITLAGGGTGSAAWYTEAAVPNLTEWPAGDYTVSCDIDATGADITYTLSLRRVNSSGTLQQTLGTSGTLSGTGLKSHTVNIGSPIATNAGDRLVGVLSASRAASHGNQTLTISVSGANDKLIGAWSEALIEAAAASSTGTSTAIGTGASIAAALASSAGTSTVSGIGASLAAAVMSAAGVSTAEAVGQEVTAGTVEAGDGFSQGTASVLAEGASLAAAEALASGASTTLAEGANLAAADAFSSGTSDAQAVGEYIDGAPAPEPEPVPTVPAGSGGAIGRNPWLEQRQREEAERELEEVELQILARAALHQLARDHINRQLGQ
jgi:hypothetical protein